MSKPSLRKRSGRPLLILLLEDDRKRVIQFTERFKETWGEGGFRLVQARSKVEAVQAVRHSRRPFDLFLLDHDLEGRAFEPVQKDNTGSGFARWLAENRGALKPSARVVVHSLNASGAHAMLETLGRGEYVPYCWPLEQWNYLHGQAVFGRSGRLQDESPLIQG